MKAMTMRGITTARVLGVFLFGWAAAASAAVDPIPDWVTLVFPTMVPKAGQTAIPAGAEAGTIRNAFQSTFENDGREPPWIQQRERHANRLHQRSLADCAARGHEHRQQRGERLRPYGRRRVLGRTDVLQSHSFHAAGSGPAGWSGWVQ